MQFDSLWPSNCYNFYNIITNREKIRKNYILLQVVYGTFVKALSLFNKLVLSLKTLNSILKSLSLVYDFLIIWSKNCYSLLLYLPFAIYEKNTQSEIDSCGLSVNKKKNEIYCWTPSFGAVLRAEQDVSKTWGSTVNFFFKVYTMDI